MDTFGTYKGCPYTWLSTGYENSLPKVVLRTFAVVSVVSLRFCPVRPRSLCCVKVPANPCAMEAGARMERINAGRMPCRSVHILVSILPPNVFACRSSLGAYSVLRMEEHQANRRSHYGAQTSTCLCLRLQSSALRQSRCR